MNKYEQVINKYKNEIDSLLEISSTQNNKINLSTIFITIKCNDEENQFILDYFNDLGIEILTDDIEPDKTPLNNVEILDNINIRPFDPSKIDIKMSPLIIDAILKRIKHKELDFESEFQRKAGLWSKVQKSQLIESILLNIPLPAFYFDATNNDKWIIIDGLQRITTLKEFVVDKSLKLSGMEFLTDLNEKMYDGLPRSLQRRIEETNITAYIINPSTPPNVKFNIFKRINTGGLVLEPQEIRNALFQGNATSFIKELAQKSEFIKATNKSIKSDRMVDREFCLRFIAFTYVQLDEYKGNMDDYLNNTMELLNKLERSKLKIIEQDFIRVMKVSEEIFGGYAFRKMATDRRKRPINKAIFEMWSHALYDVSNSDVEKLVSKQNELTNKFISLCDNYTFQNYLRSSDKQSVINRINDIKKIINECLIEE